MIQEVDKPGSDVEDYINNLESVLNGSLLEIEHLLSRLTGFSEKLKEERRLSKICLSQQSQQREPEFDTEDLGDDLADEPRAKVGRMQQGYDYPLPRNSHTRS